MRPMYSQKRPRYVQKRPIKRPVKKLYKKDPKEGAYQKTLLRRMYTQKRPM